MWKNIQINKQNIKIETNRAVLINCPHNSKFDGWSFWHPAKLVRNGKHSYAKSIGYTDDFKFKLVKYGKGKFNSRDILAEEEITVEEFEEMFGVMNENIRAPKEEETYLVVEEPEKIDKDVEVEECLRNN